MKNTLLIVLCLLRLNASASVYFHNYLKNFKKDESLNVLKTFPFDQNNENKVINSISIGAILVDGTGNRDLEIVINNKAYKLSIPEYEREDLELREFTLDIHPLKQRDIKKFKIKFPKQAGITFFGFHYRTQYNKGNYQKQFERVKSNATYRLYELDANKSKNKLVRSRGIRSLSFFPSYETLEVLREIVDYDPQFNDYDNDYIARDIISEVIDKIAVLEGENKLVEYLDLIYEDTDDRLIANIILNTIYDLKSSAGLFFAIKNHVYSPLTDRRINHTLILESIYKKSDLDSYVKYYLDTIIEEIFIYHEGNTWDQERACNVFEKAPQPGLFELLFNIIKEANHSLEYHCKKALTETFKKLDLRNEITNKYVELAKDIILEVYTPPTRIFQTGYSNTFSMRAMAIYILHEKGKYSILNEALKNDNLEKHNKELIQELIQ